MQHITDQIDERMEPILDALEAKRYSVGDLVHLVRDHGSRGFGEGWSLRIHHLDQQRRPRRSVR